MKICEYVHVHVAINCDVPQLWVRQRQPLGKRETNHSHLLPSTSSAPHNILSSPQNALACLKFPLSADSFNYSAGLHTTQQPHRPSLCSNYVCTGSRSRRWGIWIILLVRSAAQLKNPAESTANRVSDQYDLLYQPHLAGKRNISLEVLIHMNGSYGNKFISKETLEKNILS